MKKNDWITLAKALGLSVFGIAAIFAVVWMANDFAWGLLGLATAGATFFVYHWMKEREPIVDEREEAYFKGFADGKKAAEEDYMEGLIEKKK